MPDPAITPPPQLDPNGGVVAPRVVTNDAGDVIGAPPSMKDRVLGTTGRVLSSLGGRDPNKSPLDAQVQKHHDQKLAEIQMHRKNMSTYGGALATGIDPETGQPMDDAAKERYTHWYNLSKDAYAKAAGVNPDLKKQVEKSTIVVDHVIATHPKAQPAGGGAGAGISPPPTIDAGGMGPGGGPLPNNFPPSVGGTSPTSLTSAAGAGGAGQPPTPKVPSGSDPAAAAAEGAAQFQEDPTIAAPRLRQLMAERQADARALKMYKDKEGYLYDLRIKEDAAKAAAKAAAGAASGSARFGPASSVRDARLLASQGRQYNDIDGNPIDLNSIPDNMGLKFVAQGPKHWYEVYSPNSKVITVGNETYAINPMDVEAVTRGAGTDVGQHNVGSTSSSTDAASGLTTVTKRTPGTTGAAGRSGGAAAPGATASPRGGTAQWPGAAGAGGTAHVSLAKPPAGPGAPPLDHDGHIPADWRGEAMPGVRATGSVIEAANQLMDERDVDKIPQKVREVAASLARRAGWSQDKFSPLEKTQIALATRYLNEAAASPSLKALDKGFIAQLPMLGATGEGKSGLARAMTKLAATNTTPEQQEFLRIYRQLAGTISGLGKLSRGGRITEATVNRLLAELPNPSNTTGSKDAIERINRLRDEVSTALSHDSFAELVSGRAGGAAAGASAPRGGVTRPPQYDSSPQLSDAAKKWLQANP